MDDALVQAVHAFVARAPVEDPDGAARRPARPGRAGQPAGHDRRPLPQLAPQAARRRWRPCRRDPRVTAVTARAARGAGLQAGRPRRKPVHATRTRACTAHQHSARDLPAAVPQGIHVRAGDRARALSGGARREPRLRIALSQGPAGQHARLRHHDHNAFNPEIGSAEDFERFAAALAAARHGAADRPRAQSHGRDGGGQRLVARRAGERPGIEVCGLLRYRLGAADGGAARQGADPDTGRPVQQGARERRAEARRSTPRRASSASTTTSTASRWIRGSTPRHRAGRRAARPAAREEASVAAGAARG